MSLRLRCTRRHHINIDTGNLHMMSSSSVTDLSTADGPARLLTVACDHCDGTGTHERWSSPQDCSQIYCDHCDGMGVREFLLPRFRWEDLTPESLMGREFSWHATGVPGVGDMALRISYTSGILVELEDENCEILFAVKVGIGVRHADAVYKVEQAVNAAIVCAAEKGVTA